MSCNQISRFSDATAADVVFTDSASTTGGFVMSAHSGATLLVSAASSTPTTLEFGTRLSKEDSSYFTACDSTGATVTMSVEAGKSYPIPSAMFATRYVTALAQTGATVTCKIVMKG
jgi:hypothetical protein